MNSEVLPPVCPGTPKYLEAQYQCENKIVIAEKVRKTGLPQLQGNISDVWSNNYKILNIEDVAASIDKVIANPDIPKTEEPATMTILGEITNRKVNSENATEIRALITRKLLLPISQECWINVFITRMSSNTCNNNFRFQYR